MQMKRIQLGMMFKRCGDRGPNAFAQVGSFVQEIGSKGKLLSVRSVTLYQPRWPHYRVDSFDAVPGVRVLAWKPVFVSRITGRAGR